MGVPTYQNVKRKHHAREYLFLFFSTDVLCLLVFALLLSFSYFSRHPQTSSLSNVFLFIYSFFKRFSKEIGRFNILSLFSFLCQGIYT